MTIRWLCLEASKIHFYSVNYAIGFGHGSFWPLSNFPAPQTRLWPPYTRTGFFPDFNLIFARFWHQTRWQLLVALTRYPPGITGNNSASVFRGRHATIFPLFLRLFKPPSQFNSQHPISNSSSSSFFLLNYQQLPAFSFATILSWDDRKESCFFQEFSCTPACIFDYIGMDPLWFVFYSVGRWYLPPSLLMILNFL